MPNKRLRKSEEGDKYLKPSSKKFRAPKESEQDPAEVEEVIAAFKQLNKVKNTIFINFHSHFLLSLLNREFLVGRKICCSHQNTFLFHLSLFFTEIAKIERELLFWWFFFRWILIIKFKKEELQTIIKGLFSIMLEIIQRSELRVKN